MGFLHKCRISRCCVDSLTSSRVQAVSWPSILQSFGGSVDVLSEDTQTLQLVILDENLYRVDVSNTTDYFEIIVPRKRAKDNTTVGARQVPREFGAFGPTITE